MRAANKYTYGMPEISTVSRELRIYEPPFQSDKPRPINAECPVAQYRLQRVLKKLVARIDHKNQRSYLHRIRVIKELIHTQSP
jgi:hypothetical protein